MAREPHDDRVDHLYQIPLDEFTAARNALARELGPDSEVKRLEKPSLAAWAVNQIYWQRRQIHDDLIEAAESLRSTYRRQLAGNTADVSAAEVAHRAAIGAAKHAACEILDASGAGTSEAVTTAVAETLDALPGSEPPGRLSRPLRRVGFGALEGMAIAVRPTTKAKARAPQDPTAREKAPTEHDRRTGEAEARERAMIRERLRFAESAEREASTALERARRAVERAGRLCERIEQELAQATEASAAARTNEASCRIALNKAIAERERLAKTLE